MRKRILILAALVMAFSNSAALFSRQLVGALESGNPNIGVCHATNSATNPYTYNVVDANSIMKDSGHSNHPGSIVTSVAMAEEMKSSNNGWGDVIPAFNYGTDQYFPGLNNTDQGTDMLNNNCEPPVVTVTPMTVGFVNGTCDITAGYTIPNQTGVKYYIGDVKQTASFHEVVVDGPITITAKAASGYTLLGSATKSWTFTFSIPDPEDCVLGAESVTPLPITFVDDNCVLDASYTIPTTVGVKYYVNSSVTPAVAGTYLINANTVINVLAVANEGYIFNDNAVYSWSHTFVIPTFEDCHPAVVVTPVTIVFTDATCEIDASYVIPSVTGVRYYVNNVLASAGKYYVTTNKTVAIRAAAISGYVLAANSVSTWSHVFAIPTYQDCYPDVVVTPATIAFTDATCEIDGSYLIPSVTGVRYYVDNVLTSAGRYYVTTNKTVSIRAAAISGYMLTANSVSTWSHVFVIPTDQQCNPLTTVTPTQVTFTGITCDASGTYVIPSITGVEYYIGETKVAAGTYTVSVGSVITVTARAAAGYQLAGAVNSWTYTYTVPSAASCVLGTVSTTPAAVLFTPATCSVLGFYTIPTTVGVKYYIDGKAVLAGTYSSANGASVIVTAIAELDYEIKAGATNRWAYTFSAPTNCSEGGSVLGTTSSLPLSNGYQIDLPVIMLAIITFGASLFSLIFKRLLLRRTE